MKNQRHLLSGFCIALLMTMMQTSYGQLANNSSRDLPITIEAKDKDKDPKTPPIVPPPGPVDIEEWETEKTIIGIYPNPCIDNITIATNQGNKALNLSIYSLTGQVVWKGVINEKGTINVAQLHSGIYLLHDGRHSYKFQKL